MRLGVRSHLCTKEHNVRACLIHEGLWQRPWGNNPTTMIVNFRHTLLANLEANAKKMPSKDILFKRVVHSSLVSERVIWSLVLCVNIGLHN